jgi:predicted Rossmann fold flavoprotein
VSADARKPWDAIVIGAGAAGMMCAAVAGQRGARVLLIDHAGKLAEKIRISGGGRCNFTNIHARPENFLSANPHFCRSVLARYTPADFIAMVRRHRIAFHDKHKGQLFCDESSEQIIDMLRAECDAGGVRWAMPCKVARIGKRGELFEVATEQGAFAAQRVVIATGGLSIPKIGASDFGYRIASQFGLGIVPMAPALVPLTFDAQTWRPFAQLAGLSLEVDVRCEKGRFTEDLLFTHRGLSGPAILQISSYWIAGDALVIDLAPKFAGNALASTLLARKNDSRQSLANVLATLLPRRLADGWLALQNLCGEGRIAESGDKVLRALAESLHGWSLAPSGCEGYRKAEVTRGGVDTDELSQNTLEAKRVLGLYFIGEVVDVTGWLGGYNFQWAWASGFAAGQAITR